MLKPTLAIVAALSIGAVAGRSWLAPDHQNATPNGDERSDAAAQIVRQLSEDPAASDDDQLQTMVQALAGILDAEVEERRVMQQEFIALRKEIESIRDALEQSPGRGGGPSARTGTPNAVDTEAALVRAGLDPDWAAEIRRRNDKLTMDSMFLQDQARREGWTNTVRYANASNELEQRRIGLREEIGDNIYDQFLYETGLPNRVLINEVLEGSPAHQAGMKPGDEMLSYNGQRIFELNEMVSESRSGSSGKLVAVEVMRGGQVVQIYLPRGPLGVRTGMTVVDPSDGS